MEPGKARPRRARLCHNAALWFRQPFRIRSTLNTLRHSGNGAVPRLHRRPRQCTLAPTRPPLVPGWRTIVRQPRVALGLFVLLALATPAPAQTPAEFYRGKSIELAI